MGISVVHYLWNGAVVQEKSTVDHVPGVSVCTEKGCAWRADVCVSCVDLSWMVLLSGWRSMMKNSVLLWKQGQRQTLHFPLKMLNPVPLPSTSSPDPSGPCSLTSPPRWYQDSHAPPDSAGIPALITAQPSCPGSSTEPSSPLMTLGFLSASLGSVCLLPHSQAPPHLRSPAPLPLQMTLRGEEA